MDATRIALSDGAAPATRDLNHDGVVNVVYVSLAVSSALGGNCWGQSSDGGGDSARTGFDAAIAP